MKKETEYLRMQIVKREKQLMELLPYPEDTEEKKKAKKLFGKISKEIKELHSEYYKLNK